MSQVVFTNIDSINELKTARWSAGDNDSYDATKKAATPYRGFSVIGRQDALGNVQPAFAASRDTGWREVNAWHVQAALYFDRMLGQAPAGDTLRPFFETIDDESVLFAVRQLVAAECGSSPSDEDRHGGVCRVMGCIAALGVTRGDWMYLPMMAAVK